MWISERTKAIRPLSKVQYFMFFPERFKASEVSKVLDTNYVKEWDYALLFNEFGLTMFFAASVGGNKFKWVSEGLGTNLHELKFMESGDYGYEKFPEWKRLGK